ncbi:MAG: hypothetical protein RLY90_753 [Pseudomonadota bacterium]|jgi:hypothetical protein
MFRSLLAFVFCFSAMNMNSFAQTNSENAGKKYSSDVAASISKDSSGKTTPEVSQSLQAHPPQSGNEPMLTLGPKNKPFTEPLKQTIKYDYYDCKGIVAPWFREVMVAEMNYFAELNKLPFVKGDVCVVSIGTTRSLAPGRISVHLYPSIEKRNDCVIEETCPSFRSINLIPKNNVLYRSYFLSDINRKLIAQYCVTAKGKLHMDTTCYGVE